MFDSPWQILVYDLLPACVISSSLVFFSDFLSRKLHREQISTKQCSEEFNIMAVKDRRVNILF